MATWFCRRLCRSRIQINAPQAAALALLTMLVPLHAQHWDVQFFHDRNDSSFEIHDFVCPAISKCIAAGALVETNRRKAELKGNLVITRDGGAHWSYEEVHEVPDSLFFLNDSLGWMVTEKGIWQTTEGGTNWKKLKGIKGIARVWFENASHGWAVGDEKSIYETTDGGREWTKLAAVGTTAASSADTVYDWIDFQGKTGVIAGASNPLNGQFLGRRMADRSVLLVSSDSGKSWNSVPIGGPGKLDRVRPLDSSRALGLVEFFGKSKMPSEIFDLDLAKGTSKPIFNEADKVARDFQLLRNGEMIVAAVRRTGEAAQAPVPTRLELLGTTSMSSWIPEKVDYRAVAMQAFLASPDSNHVWVATDTGMILKRIE